MSQPLIELTQEIELMTRVASLYYLEDITQAEIAEMCGLSRPKVGRLLRKARAEGIVEITVHTHPALSMQLESELKERFGLRQVLLVGDQTDPNAQRAQVARTIASFLARSLDDGSVVAVGMGRNVGAVPDHASNVPQHDCTFISAIGGSPQVGQMINPDEVCRRLAERFGGRSESLYAPAYAESRAVHDMFLSHDNIRQTLDRARQADFALVGIGGARDDSAVVRMGCVSADEMRPMREAGAVGDILGFFFDIHGDPVANSIEHRVVGLSSSDLRRIPTVIGAASEASKAASILGAVRTGIIKVLATSVGNAHSILALAEEYSDR
jgi:DNA-binding transcriptional regulator LsrR (DeoR family)